ncbi:LysR family transcriptional regulator [Sphingomonas qilianensis]|uniref:LysR family transcriptional regulator n=1 Tax=Sphingomonas qilianensis TaxID=1736690 RepID=A0ABU9XT72_9SPHN
MTDSSAPPARAASGPPAPAPPSPSRRAHWTPAKQRIFLAALLECGCVAEAARAAGMSPSSAHRLRARLGGAPFVRAWDQALAVHARRLADPFAPARIAPAASPSRS